MRNSIILRMGVIRLVLAIATTAGLLLVCSAARSFGAVAVAAPSRGAQAMHRPYIWQPLYQSGYIDVMDSPTIVIQQFTPPQPISQAVQPATPKTYVQPHWIDGGFGVEVLVPGHWVATKPSATP